MGQRLEIKYRVPGPVAQAFLASDAFVRCLMGPVGSGKTSCVLMDIVQRAARQTPSNVDGWRRFKTRIIRDTYRNLEKTTIPTAGRWLPHDLGEWTGGEGGRPATQTIRFNQSRGPIELILEFVGMNLRSAEEVLRGWEGTACYINEADLVSPDVLNMIIATGRLWRYPPKDPDGSGGASWSGIMLDCNAPDEDNYIVADFMTNPKPDYALFQQPGGMEPDAENLENLPGGRAYYERIVANAAEWEVFRFVHNRIGYSRRGKPVYPEFNDRRHVARVPLLPVRGLPIIIGADAGLTPAATIWQRMASGQWRGLDELVTNEGDSVGPRRFGDRLNRLLADKYGQFEAGGWVDPSAAYGADHEGGERTWIETVAHVTQVRFRPAPTNELTARIEAVRVPLTRSPDGQEPGLIISPTMQTLRAGFNSKYRFQRLQVSGDPKYARRPEKNMASHVHDSAQYALSGGGELAEVTGRRERRELAARMKTGEPVEYNPYSW